MLCGLLIAFGHSLAVEEILGAYQAISLLAGDFVIGAICTEDACGVRVLKIGFKYFVDAFAIFGVLDREDGFDPAIEVAWHPVGAACEDVGLAAIAIFEVEDAAVFQVASKYTAHADVFAHAFYIRH